MATKALLYGFGPYEEFDRNISETILGLLDPSPELVRKVFDTRFSRAMFQHSLRQHSPDVIIGLGQHRRARKLRLERKALNRWGDRQSKLRAVSKSGPPRLYVNLRLPEDENTTVTYDAGTYVCNFSMYVCLEHCITTGARFAFIHVPRDYDVALATAYVSRAVRFTFSEGG
jgi:pyrrolidone-carboxylate peptidase